MTKTPRPDLSIVIPVFNGAATIAELVGELRALEMADSLEIILVDDGSKDESAAVCRKLAQELGEAPVHFVKLSRNFGEHNAVMAGLAQAQGDYVITMDDDLQNPPGEVERLYQFCRNGNRDVVYSFYAAKKHNWFRNLGSRFANATADFVLDKPKGLYLSSFRCMNRFVVDSVLRYQGPFPYIDGLIMQATSAIGRLQVEHLERRQGRSNYTLTRLLRLWLTILFNFSVLPLRISMFLGLFMSIVGFGMFGLVVYDYLTTGIETEGWITLMSAIVLFAGVQLFILGIVGEYLGRLYLTVNGKPQFLVAARNDRTPSSTAASDKAEGADS